MHTNYRESIHELIDGTLGAIRRAELERHLADCAECQSFLDDMQAIRAAADSLDPLQPPDGVWMQIAGRLRQEGRVQAPPAPTPTRAPHFAMLAIAASLLLAVGVGIGLLVNQYRTPNAPTSIAATTPSPGQSNAA
ncbi:MAG: zf-HC2 domain-containing protein, partial [Acidobacteria bacterium]|nr:zf-HC2 domain-containing protein [Acidobacteriota bacterium]